jgi:hypothetical protein
MFTSPVFALHWRPRPLASCARPALCIRCENLERNAFKRPCFVAGGRAGRWPTPLQRTHENVIVCVNLGGRWWPGSGSFTDLNRLSPSSADDADAEEEDAYQGPTSSTSGVYLRDALRP